MAAPVTSLWENIIKTIGALLIGWGLDKFIKWLQNPKNKQAVDDFKDFVVVAIPAILKGIIAVMGYNLVKNLIKFTAGLVAGGAKLLIFLGKMALNLGRLAMKNKSLALALGLGAIGGLAITHMAKKGADDLKDGTQPGEKEDEALDVEEKVNSGEIPPKDESVKLAGGGLVPLQRFQEGGFANMTNTMETSTSDSEGNFSMGVSYVGPEEAKVFLADRGFPSMELMDGTVVPDFGKMGAEKMTEGLQSMKEMMIQNQAPPERIAQIDQLMVDPHAQPDYVANIINQIVPGSWDNNLAKESASFNKMSGGGNVPLVKPMKSMVPSEGTDTVPAMLTPGEFVMSRGAVNKWGVGTLENMNAAGGGTNKPKVSGKVYARGGGRVPMIYARGGGLVDGWSTSKTVDKPSIFDRVRGAVGSAASSVKQFLTGGRGKSDDANQLVSSPPSTGGKATIIPVPAMKKPTTVPGPSPSSAAPAQPFFSPVDQENFSSLITKSMYNILE